MKKLKIGDRIHNGSFKGVVQDADKEYVWLIWDGSRGMDRVHRTSPLLMFLKVKT